ncbi:hypothetical protein [Halobaculum sp. EA56]|uniref:hypothetical protein n=1 Tax=Halobaculum sp. EA56 TaxID=3421648 RepID=UPI003EBA4422
MATRRFTPPQLPEYIDERGDRTNLVILGGPWVGKSDFLDDNANRYTYLGYEADLGLDTLDDSTDDTPVVIDDFYRWYRSDANATQWDWLFRASSGIVLVTRPRRFDWLLEETDLDNRLDDSFEVIHARYPKTSADVPLQYEGAVETCCDHSSYSEAEIERNISKLHYEYEFDHDYEVYDSYLPFLVCHDSLRTLDSSGGVFEQVTAISDRITQTGFLQTVRDRASELAVGTSGVTVAGFTGQPVFLGLTVTLLLKLRERHNDGRPRSNVQSFLGPLADDRLLPHTAAVFEEELDVPPGTIEVLQEAVHDTELFESLETLFDLDPEEIDDLADTVASLEDDLSEIEAETQQLSEWVDGLVADAVRDPEWLIRQNRRTRVSMLREQGVPSEMAVGVARPFGRQTLRPTRLKEVATALKDALDEDSNRAAGDLPPCLIVRGPRGVGKTSFVCRLIHELDGVDAGVLDETRDPGLIRTRVREKAGSDQFVLVYKHTGHSITTVSRLLGETLVADVDAIVIEVTDSLYPDLAQAWETSPEGGHDDIADRLERMVDLPVDIDNPVSLDPLDDDTIAGLIEPFELDPDSEEHEDIIQASDGFPLLAIIAGSLVVTGEDVGELSQQRIFVRHLENALTQIENHPTDIERVLETLAAVRYVPDMATLFNAAEVEPHERESVERLLKRYLRGYIREANQGYQLTPEIYTRLLFQRSWFSGTDTDLETAGERRQAVLADLYDEFPEGLTGCAANLGGVWYHDIPYSATDDGAGTIPQPTAEDIIAAATELIAVEFSPDTPTTADELRIAIQTPSTDTMIRREMLRRLLIAGIPLSPNDLPFENYLVDYLVLMELTAFQANRYSSSGESIDMGLDRWLSEQLGVRLRQWIANHIASSIKPGLAVAHEDIVRQLCEVTQACAMELESKTGTTDPVAFVTGVYGLAITRAVEYEPLIMGNTLDEWFEILEEELTASSEDFTEWIQEDERGSDSVDEYLLRLLYSTAFDSIPDELDTETANRLRNQISVQAHIHGL